MVSGQNETVLFVSEEVKREITEMEPAELLLMLHGNRAPLLGTLLTTRRLPRFYAANRRNWGPIAGDATDAVM